MAEIKSTLDLVMEKTKHLTLSEEEKKAAERDEQLKKVPGYVQRFLEGTWGIRHLETELGQFATDIGSEMTRHLIEGLLSELDPEERGEKCLEGLEHLAREEERIWVDQIRDVLTSFKKVKQQKLPLFEEQMRTNLSALGIGGDAVVIRPNHSPEWREMEQDYRRQLREIETAWKLRLRA